MSGTCGGKGSLRSFRVDGVVGDEPVWAGWDEVTGLTGEPTLLARAESEEAPGPSQPAEVALLLRLVRSCERATTVVFDFDARAADVEPDDATAS